MGRPGMAEKRRKPATHSGGRHRVCRPDPARSGRLAVKFGQQGRLAVLLLPGRCVYKGGDRNRLPRPKLDWPENGSKQPSFRFTVLGSFSRVFGAENECFGARVLFGM